MSELTEKQQKRHIYGIIFGIFIVFILIITMIFFAVRYGGKPLAGAYDIYSYTNDGKEDTDSVAKLKGYGMNIEIIFNTDKTGSITYSGGASNQTRTFTYTDSTVSFDAKDQATGADSTNSNDSSKKQTASYTHSGDFIILKMGDENIKFKRVEKSESEKTSTKTGSNATTKTNSDTTTKTTNNTNKKPSTTKTTSDKK